MPKRIGNDAGKELRDTVNAMADNVDNTLADAVDGGSSFAPEIHTAKAGKEFNQKDTVDQFKTLADNSQGNSILSPQEYQDLSPDIKLIGQRKPEGLSSGNISAPKVIDTTGTGDGVNTRGRAATQLDVSKLDESMIMSMPFIKTTEDIVPGILFLKPKDPMVRFRWVNYKNWEGGNYQRFRAIGFENACPEDVDESTPVGPNCIEGTEIKWYDVILMKCNVFKLMSLYKRNILSSLQKVGRFQQNAQTEAQRQFNEDIYNGLVEGDGPHKGQRLLSAFKRMKEQGYNVEFYVPGLDEKSDKDFTSGLSDEAFVSGAAIPTR